MAHVFAERLKQVREKRGMSQLQLGVRCGASYQQICAYERGANLPKLDRLVTLAEVLDCSADFLCGLEEE